ncbi:MAG: hypothetical protein DMF92_12545, partial [Acidobacteria bacterium]
MSAPGLDRDRWQRIKQLVADAATRPPAERARFLDDACPDDAAMRQEVEALLAAHDQAGDFFERRPPAAAALAGAGFAAAPLHLAPGRLLGPYEIVDAIGAGGMGEVYRARDTRLHRDVALKVLPLALVADPSRRARFVQEARAASALEHPHIAVIHDIGEVEGVTFIAMELVRGEPLSDVVARGPLAPARALDVAIEIAEGLARAHEIGVVHRDLKPANVMLAEERHAKIIDFGLAKLVDALGGDGAVTGAWNVTESGMALGTASYMSPEQARGAKVDHRTDIFSFGILLYELLTGHSPFRGTSRVDTLHAILYDPAPPLPPSIGPATDDLQRILEKCLAKEPEDRYQGMRDLVVDLRAARRRLDSSQIRAAAGAPAGSATVGRARLRRGALPAAALMLVGVIAGRAWWIARTETPGTAAEAPLLHLTSDGGLTTDPALSPDGKLVVYASDRAGGDNLDLWVQQIGGGAPFRLTFDPADEYEPSFSPDGARIVFRSERDGGGVYVMPALGGEPRLIAKTGRQPRFSRDGTR